MPSYNHITLLGNCTRDPELRYAKSGTPVCTLGLATTHISGTGDDRREDTCFVDITFFGRTAEIASEYTAKGTQILVSGRLQYQTWEAQDGSKRSKHVVIGEQLQLLQRAPAAVPAPETATASTATAPDPKRRAPWNKPQQAPAPVTGVGTETDDSADDIPF